MKRLLIAIQFLTIIPVKKDLTADERDIAGSASAFVFVGILQGILLIAVDYLGVMVFHHDLVIGLMLFALVLSNGGFHLDGLADTFDGLAVKSSGDIASDREKRLAVMKDASAGPVGVTAIVFALGLKYLLIKNLSHLSYFAYYSSLLIMPAVSKWTMVIAMCHGRPARRDGLGKIFIEGTGVKEAVFSVLFLLMVFVLIFWGLKSQSPDNHLIFFIILTAIMYGLVRLFVGFFNNKFGGLNGDMLGALSEIAEISFLVITVAWARFLS